MVRGRALQHLPEGIAHLAHDGPARDALADRDLRVPVARRGRAHPRLGRQDLRRVARRIGRVRLGPGGPEPAPQTGRMERHVLGGPAALAANLGQDGRDPERGGGRGRRSRRRTDEQVAQAVGIGQLARARVDGCVPRVLDPGERHQRLVHVAAVHVQERIRPGDHVVGEPAGQALRRGTRRVAGEAAVEVSPVERVDVDGPGRERRRAGGQDRHDRAPDVRGIEGEDHLPQGGDGHVLGAMDPGGDRHAGPRSGTVDKDERHLDARAATQVQRHEAGRPGPGLRGDGSNGERLAGGVHGWKRSGNEPRRE